LVEYRLSFRGQRIPYKDGSKEMSLRCFIILCCTATGSDSGPDRADCINRSSPNDSTKNEIIFDPRQAIVGNMLVTTHTLSFLLSVFQIPALRYYFSPENKSVEDSLGWDNAIPMRAKTEFRSARTVVLAWDCL